MAFGNAFALLDDYDGFDALDLSMKVNANKAATAAAEEKAAAEKAAEAKEVQKQVVYNSGRGRGRYSRGRGGGRGLGFYDNGRFGNNGNGTGWNGDTEGRGYNGGRGRGGYSHGVFRGGKGRRFERPHEEGLKRTDSKDENTNNGNAASERKIPTTAEQVAEDVQLEKGNADQLVSKDFLQNNEPTTVDEEEEKRRKKEKEIQEEERRKKKERWEKELAEDAKKMTLTHYYSKVVVEKKKALEPFLKVEERKVVADEEFEGMQLIGKKKEEEIFVKLGSEKEKPKKNSLEKEEKLRKSVSLDEFLKPAGGQRYRPVHNNSRGTSADVQGRRDPQVEDRSRPPLHGSADRREQYPRGRGRGHGFGGRVGRQDPVRTEDPQQFPELGKASKVEAVKP